MEADDLYRDEGPFAYANWKAMQAGLSATGAKEYLLYTDALIVGNPEDCYGPYQIINTMPESEVDNLATTMALQLKPAIALRLEEYRPNQTQPSAEEFPSIDDLTPVEEDLLEIEDIPANESIMLPLKTDASRYHGGTIVDEIAALASLCIGIRLESGPCTRLFEPGNDCRGKPVTRTDKPIPSLPPPLLAEGSMVLAQASGPHSLKGIAPLQTLTELNPRQAIALIRTARLYQDALWIVESEPELSWVLLVSAIEVAAGEWRSAKDTPLERLRASRPKLEELLKPYGDEL